MPEVEGKTIHSVEKAVRLLDLLTVRYGTLAQKHGLPQE